MNSNAWHNIFNMLGMVMTGLTWFLVKMGCVDNPVTHMLDCSAAPIDPTWAGTLAGLAFLVGGIKMAMNVFRDGLSGLWKKQPPVQ